MNATKKQSLDATLIREHQEQTWQDYASVQVLIPDRPGFTARLCLLYNGSGCYRVELGTQSLYVGSDLHEAIAAWEKA
jgi:hypothetical protein